MTLQEWSKLAGISPASHGDCKIVPIILPHHRQLFQLLDYRVSSVTGGSVWLVQR